MKCSMCSFSWADKGSKAETCHYDELEYGDVAPCDDDQLPEEESEDDYAYDRDDWDDGCINDESWD